MSYRKPTRKNSPEYDPEFLWPIARWELGDVGGWVPASGTLPHQLELVLAPDNPHTLPTWAPMAQAPRLYLEAAQVEWRNPQAVLDWVNHRGNLWWRTPRDEPPDVRLIEIQKELRAIRESVRLFKELQRRGPVLTITSNWPHVRAGLSVSPEGIAWAKKVAAGTRSRLAYAFGWAVLADTLAEHLQEGLRSILMIRPSVRPRLVRIGRKGRRQIVHLPAIDLGRIRFVPHSLAACLWWQLYLDASGAKDYRLCPGCGEWFAPGRTDKGTCSDRCYMRVFRRGGRGKKSKVARVKKSASRKVVQK